ncbi:MAG: response regulator transcription factor [Mycobacterium sp.]|nr:response regulator transcription factor [Mycobacterium sp.]
MAVVVVDDDRLARECLSAQLNANGVEASCAWDLPSLFSAIDHRNVDVILLNVSTPDSTTLLQVSLDIDAATKVVIFGLSTDRESEIIAAAESGVSGLHLRSESFEHLLELVRTAGQGQAQCSSEVSGVLMRRVYAFATQTNPDSSTDSLTARENEILELLEQGLTNQQIASRLSVTLNTVKNHVHSLLKKLGVGSRAEAVRVYQAARFTSRG